MRHWHAHEDEFVYVLDGELVLATDGRRAGAEPRECVPVAFPPARATGTT